MAGPGSLQRDDATPSPGRPMSIEVNGEPQEAPAGCSVRDLLDRLDVGKRRVAVAVNGEVVPRSRHATKTLSEGDRVEVLEAVGGG